jgi:hypothetical protein
MTDEEKRQIEREAREDARWESRVEALESSVRRLWYGVGAAALLIGTSIWDSLKAVLFK